MASGVSLRIPSRGGLSEGDTELPRGHLLLRVVAAEEPDPGVHRVAFSLRAPSLVPGSEPGSLPNRLAWAVIVLVLVGLAIAFITR
jgi:hypothetical protein